MALAQMRITSTSNSMHTRVFVGPRNLDTAYYRSEFPEWEFLDFDVQHFTSVQAYSSWMTSDELYSALLGFEFMTMCQQDAVLIRPVHEIDMHDIDYVGAPWDPPVRVLRVLNRMVVASGSNSSRGPLIARLLGRRYAVGNGGLSTRRVETMVRVSRALATSIAPRLREALLEDVYYATFGPAQGLRLAHASRAGVTFAEATSADLSGIGSLIGFHGLSRWNPELLAQILNDPPSLSDDPPALAP